MILCLVLKNNDCLPTPVENDNSTDIPQLLTTIIDIPFSCTNAYAYVWVRGLPFDTL